mmetsp:Transcript_2730/g.12222  ORF Transcript_2730/g.12222 Transcript_2730/m.12222 type:complete len:283 (+) Transcript_2730:204-1052(+)
MSFLSSDTGVLRESTFRSTVCPFRLSSPSTLGNVTLITPEPPLAARKSSSESNSISPTFRFFVPGSSSSSGGATGGGAGGATGAATGGGGAAIPGPRGRSVETGGGIGTVGAGLSAGPAAVGGGTAGGTAGGIIGAAGGAGTAVRAGGGGGGMGAEGRPPPPAVSVVAPAPLPSFFLLSMDSLIAVLTSSSVVPKMSGLVRASINTFVATSSSFAMVLSLSFASIASFCTFHLGSMSEILMCSAIWSTAMSSPVIGDTANLVASTPPEAFALASAAICSGFL